MKPLLALLLALCPLRAATYFLTVAGLGGAPEYETQFKQLAGELERALHANGAGCKVITLTGETANREKIREAFSQLTSEMKPEDAFGVVLIGHGTWDGTEFKFNVPGPDLTGTELAALMNGVPAERQMIVNTASASGASLPVLARKDRVVITATKSGTERNATVFARYWVNALQNAAADADKNGTVSALEAFRYAQSKTAAYFQSEKLLATEHPMLDDTGAKEGVRDPSPKNSQGLIASAFPVVRMMTDAGIVSLPKNQKLVSKKEQLEAAIDRLKYQKAALPPEVYKKQMSDLLLELARTQAEIDK